MNSLNRRSIYWGVSLLVLSAAATAFVLIKEFKGQAIVENLKAAKGSWIVAGLVIMVIYSLSEALNLERCLRLSGCRPSTWQCVRYALAGFFFSSITPSASGGQPAQLILMKRDGINLSFGAFSLLAGVVSFQISSVLLGICGAIYVKQAGIIQNSNGFLLLFIVGFSLNFAVLMLELCVMFSESFCNFAEDMTKRIAQRFREKHKRAALTLSAESRLVELFAEYRKAAILLRKSKRLFAKMLFTSFLQLVLFNSIPFFCAGALGLNAGTLGLNAGALELNATILALSSSAWLSLTLMESMLFVSVSSLPLPGASGVTEAGFAALFGSAFSRSSLASLLILSRTVSFIIPLIFTGLVTLVLKIRSTMKMF